MAFKVAVASSDGIHIDLHYGHADKFYIFNVHRDGSYEQSGIVTVTGKEGACSPEQNCSSQGNTGCGGGGCHGAEVFSLDTSFLEDSKYVLAAKVGKGIEKALLRNKITAFSVEMPIEQAIQKMVIYENRLNQFR